MDHTPEDHLQQAAKLACQAAAQMRRAAALAEQAAQLLQSALTPPDQAQSSAPVQMAVRTSKRKAKQHIRPEATKLLESTAFRQFDPPTISAGVAERTHPSPSENNWDDGDNWWKPLSSSDAD